jgi:HPt (histidine-containing phosphotransfer) domain-containing protein
MRQALAQGDPLRAERVAHALKGSSSHFGATRLVNLCLAMEEMGRQNQLAAARALLPALDEEFRHVESALQEERRKRLA